jgi:cytidylate kinase
MVDTQKTCTQPTPTVLCISGLAGTGKSTLAKKLAQKYNLHYYSGGDALKDLAKQEGYDISVQGWWESPDGLTFLKERLTDPKFDRAVDAKLLEYAKEGNVLLDSWTMPWLFKGGFKIWLEASVEKRAMRVAERDHLPFIEACKMLEEKEKRTKEIYKELYGFDLGEDLSPFDFVLDTDHLTASQVFEVLCHVVDNLVFPTPNV